MEINCPNCTQILFRDFNTNSGNLGFKTKCPHCKALTDIKIRQISLIDVNGKIFLTSLNGIEKMKIKEQMPDIEFI